MRYYFQVISIFCTATLKGLLSDAKDIITIKFFKVKEIFKLIMYDKSIYVFLYSRFIFVILYIIDLIDTIDFFHFKEILSSQILITKLKILFIRKNFVKHNILSLANASCYCNNNFLMVEYESMLFNFVSDLQKSTFKLILKKIFLSE